MTSTGLVHFDHALHASHAWLNELMDELGWQDGHCAYQAMRSVLHALRDHLPIEDVIDLGAELPMLIRGSYYEGWIPNEGPRKGAKKTKFLAHVAEQLRNQALSPEKVTQGVLRVLANHVSHREIEEIKQRLPDDVRLFFESQLVV
jgi:uncharacterized protein (DUF2267 family)